MYLSRPTNVTKQVELISCYFTTSPGGRAGGLLEKSILRLTQPSLAGTGAELGNNESFISIQLIETADMRLFKESLPTPKEYLDLLLNIPIRILCSCGEIPILLYYNLFRCTDFHSKSWLA